MYADHSRAPARGQQVVLMNMVAWEVAFAICYPPCFRQGMAARFQVGRTYHHRYEVFGHPNLAQGLVVGMHPLSLEIPIQQMQLDHGEDQFALAAANCRSSGTWAWDGDRQTEP